jgi:hypothetical protein
MYRRTASLRLLCVALSLVTIALTHRLLGSNTRSRRQPDPPCAAALNSAGTPARRHTGGSRTCDRLLTKEAVHLKTSTLVGSVAADHEHTLPPAYTTGESSTPAAIGLAATTVTVVATPVELETTEGFERRISVKEIEASPGSFGDPSRFIQTMPGVVSDNDKFNDFIVRGGNPSETLFIVDNIELPSINQLALSDTTGGFVSMIDNATIHQMVLHTDAFDSKYDQRLSAIVEISTRKEARTATHVESELGLAGAGVSLNRPWGPDGSTFFSARQSLLNLLTDDIGLNGVPIFRNSLVRADNRINERNNWWGLSLSGIDSIAIHPGAADTWETNPYDINYQGWRNTSGLNWQHIFSGHSFGVSAISNSQQSQSVLEKSQLLKNATVYAEDTSDGITTLKYDQTFQANPWLTLTAGTRASVDRLNYRVKQPLGLQNPYSQSAAPTDAMSLDRRFSTFSSAQYLQTAILLPRGMKFVAGERVSQWAIVGDTVSTPKLLFIAPVFGRLAHAGYAEYAQLPPSLYLLSFSNQQTLKPIRVRQWTMGLDVLETRRARLSVEAYQKRYTDYPVALNFPQLSLANIADTFGQAFLMFPMTSRGKGLARGVEASLGYSPMSRLTLTCAATYSRSWYSGLDGVLRPGNFDLPIVANLTGNLRAGKGFAISVRYSGSSGRPYTPDSPPLSEAQNRDVYDLARINAERAAPYRRLDLRLDHGFALKRGFLTWHIGLDNALGTSNFYSNEWRPRAGKSGVLAQDQMPRFPEGGVKFSFGGPAEP